jgi:ABC-type oligopeptide transport system ATPase subunit
VGLLSRSGSGKSTLGRIALNLEPPDAGECFFCGRLLVLQDGRIMERVESMQDFTPIPQGAISHLLRAILPSAPMAASP